MVLSIRFKRQKQMLFLFVEATDTFGRVKTKVR